MKFKKIEAGWYATEDGKFAVVIEAGGYSTAYEREAYGDGNDGWALTFSPGGELLTDHQSGETLNWFDTKREAIENSDSYGGRALREHEARAQRRADAERALAENDDQRDYAEERFNEQLMRET